MTHKIGDIRTADDEAKVPKVGDIVRTEDQGFGVIVGMDIICGPGLITDVVFESGVQCLVGVREIISVEERWLRYETD